jgi:hypothetical protein
MKRVVIATIVAAGFAAAGCAGDEQCIILANGGNKLCGADAAAWCDSTDSLREDATGTGYPSDDTTIRDAQETCDEIRADQ